MGSTDKINWTFKRPIEVRQMYEWIPTTEEIMDDVPTLQQSISRHMYKHLLKMERESELTLLYGKEKAQEIMKNEVSFGKRLERLEDTYNNGHLDSQRFYRILLDLAELHDRKQADYGRDTDPFANVRAAAQWGMKPSLGVMLRMGDKFGRLQSFAQKGTLENESVEDSLLDIAVYALICLVLLQNGE